MHLKSLLFSSLLLGTSTNSIICAEKENEVFSHCHGCDEPVEPWLTEENKKTEPHFNCSHTNHMHKRCAQLWMLEKLEKNCPECRAEGHLKIAGNIPEEQRVAGVLLKHEMLGLMERTTSSIQTFSEFNWSCIIKSPEFNGPHLEFTGTNDVSKHVHLSLILRLTTVAQKNTILVKELYLKQQKRTSSNPFVAFLKYLSDNPGKHGNLITYLEQCKNDFELVSKCMPHIVDYWDKKAPIYTPTMYYHQLDESLKNNWGLLQKYRALQEKFTLFTTLTIINHPVTGTVTLGDIEEIVTNNPLLELKKTESEIELKKLLKSMW